jgi:hypothetical protein
MLNILDASCTPSWPNVKYIRQRILLTLGALTVRPWVWNQTKPTQVKVRGSFVSLELRNRSSRYWFRNCLRLDMNVYDMVSQIEWRFVLRTEEQLFFCARRSVLVKLSRKCDMFRDWFSVANYHLGSQWRLVLSRKCDLFKDWFSVANYQLWSQCQTVISFLFCVSEEV